MTTAADDPAVEDAFEAYLAGRPVPDEGAALASFAGAVRATATRPGRPNAALAELLATGLLADQSSPSARTARSDGSAPSRRAARIRNRRRFAMLFPALLAKVASAGAVAQATAGAGAVVVAVTGAGIVGVLPDPVQDSVASVVETITPLDIEGGDETADVTVQDDEGTPDAASIPTAVATTTPAEPSADAFDAEAWADKGPAEGQSFGSWVSEGAQNKAALEAAAALRGDEGFRFGQLVRTWAQQKHVDLAEVEVDGVELEELIETEPTTAPAVAEPTTAPAQPTATTESGNRGSGKGTGNAGGHGGGNGGGSGGSGKGNGRN
ncbi:hypothetical protein ACI78T_05605 [Blastococcus sp. SYSU D00922]